MALAISYTFSPTTTIQSSQANQNFTDIVNYINNTACVAGMAVIWTGAIVNIPTGWALDNNSKDKFIIGAGNLYNPGDTGGEATHTLTSDEMPAHTHNTQRGYGGGNNQADRLSGYLNENNPAAIATSSAGGGNAHNNLPPYYAYAIIKKS